MVELATHPAGFEDCPRETIFALAVELTWLKNFALHQTGETNHGRNGSNEAGGESAKGSFLQKDSFYWVAVKANSKMAAVLFAHWSSCITNLHASAA